MSSRTPIGATNRADLFGKRDQEQNPPDPEPTDGKNEPLQLEHILGYAGDYRSTVIASALDEHFFVKRY